MTIKRIGYFGERMDLHIRQGGTLGPFRAVMRNPVPAGSPTGTVGTLVNLTGATVRGQIRKKALDTAIVKTLTCTITNPTGGEYEFGLSATDTATIVTGENLEKSESKYVWDLELLDASGRVTPLYYGDVYVLREVTR